MNYVCSGQKNMSKVYISIYFCISDCKNFSITRWLHLSNIMDNHFLWKILTAYPISVERKNLNKIRQCWSSFKSIFSVDVCQNIPLFDQKKWKYEFALVYNFDICIVFENIQGNRFFYDWNWCFPKNIYHNN